jgi:chaperonin GroEL
MDQERDPFGRIIPKAKPRTQGRAQVVGTPEAHRHFLIGINAMANLLAPTYGPLGGRVAGSSNDNQRIELWDGSATVMRRVFSLGRADADLGAMLLRNMVWRVEQRVGDGGATAALLARRLTARGMRLLAAGVNAMELSRGLRDATAVAIDAIRAQSRPVHDEDTLSRMALAVTGDAALSSVLGELRALLGPEGYVRLDKLVAPYLERRYVAGAWLPAQIASMHLYEDAGARTAVLAPCAVALVDEPLTTAEAALALCEAAIQRGAAALFILAPEISGGALNLIVTNHQQPREKRRLALLAARLVAVQEERLHHWADLEVLTGARLLGGTHTRSALRLQPDDLGFAERVEFARDGVALQATRERRTLLNAEVAALHQRLAPLPFDAPERPALVRRLATLSGGMAELRIGASSQYERDRLHASAERGLKVLTAALRGGAVAGAGAAFVHALPALEEHAGALQAGSPAHADRAFGARLLVESLDAPLAQIARNAGVNHPAAIVAQVAERGAPWTWDALESRLVDSSCSGLLDATDVVIAALSGAVSAAQMALTTDAIVYHRNPQQSLEP